jgi:hypothetical protein
MSPAVLYRIASILLVLFAAGHTLGFRRVDPRWGLDATIGALKATQFQVQGFTRSYWGFYTGFGFFVTVLLVFAGILAWQLGALPKDTLRSLRVVTWALALSFVAVTFLSWRYFFIAPVVFSGVIAACLLLAAWGLRTA